MRRWNEDNWYRLRAADFSLKYGWDKMKRIKIDGRECRLLKIDTLGSEYMEQKQHMPESDLIMSTTLHVLQNSVPFKRIQRILGGEEMAKADYTQLSKEVIEAVGGKETGSLGPLFTRTLSQRTAL